MTEETPVEPEEVVSELAAEETIETAAEETIETADEETPIVDSISNEGVDVDENKEARIREGILERENPIE
jgi:hypothetical protein